MALKTIKTNHRIKHGAKPEDVFEANKTLVVGKDIDAKLAAELVKRGLASDEQDDSSDDAPASDPVTLESFTSAVDLLDKDNEDHWTKSNKPDCKALEGLDCVVTAKERDAFWEQYEGPQKA